MNNPQQFYKKRLAEETDKVHILSQKSHWFILIEISCFIVLLLSVVLAFWTSMISLWTVVGLLSICIWGLTTKIDVRNERTIKACQAVCDVYQHEMEYHKGDFHAFQSYKDYTDSHHEYSYDLDIFGPDMLFSRLNRTVTTGGSDQLAYWFQHLSRDDERQKAVSELSQKEEFVTVFKSQKYTDNNIVNTDKVQHAIDNLFHLSIPSFLVSKPMFYFAWLAIIGFILFVILSLFHIVSGTAALWWGVLQFFAVFFLCSKIIRSIGNVIGNLKEDLIGYIQLISLVEHTNFEVNRNNEIKQKLDGAMLSFSQLDSYLKGLDSRNNIFGLVIMNVLFLNDFFLVRKFNRWQKENQATMSQWIKATSTMDAYVSLATMVYNHPETVWPRIIGGNKIVYKAKGLYHPFLGEHAVRNDFEIKDHNYYIITGANMAGKSTFLRALGINYVMSMVGLPVFAEQYEVSCFNLFSSMRTQDDLNRGISYFNAELLRLKQLIHSCKLSQLPTLIILDEILKGTNSVDKLNGSHLFLEAISKMNVSGVIATHDLELSKMSVEQPDVFHNYCFEIQLDSSITYSYKVTPGVARNQNATYLLKKILKENQP